MADIFAQCSIAQDERTRWAARDSTSPIEEGMDLLRLLEYPQLLGKTYLDHAGTTQWAKSLTHGFAQLMTEDLFGNPHSESTPSKLSDERIEATREKALRFFGADPEYFDLIFVPNATGAIKLVHDCFKDYATAVGRNWWYGYHKDSHTSLVGMREGAHKHRCFRYDREVDLWIDSRGLAGAEMHEVGLFAYPGQSNMTGKRFSLDWPARIRKRVRSETHILLDAAALVSTGELDLSNHATAPDFISLSFYKIFGFPNLGALIVRKSAAKVLQSRKFFGGGTVEMVISVNDSWVAKKQTSLHSRLEDGTLPFTAIFALDLAIDTHKKLYGPNPMKYISMHTSRLVEKLYNQLIAIRHSNGISVVIVYKDKATVYGDARVQGATIAFNIQKPIGGLVPFTQVEKEADTQGIYIRSGSLCNPGGFATYLDWSPKQLHDAYAEGHRCSEPLSAFQGKALGVVRVSLGAMSIEADVDAFVEFVKSTYVDRVFDTGGPIVMPELVCNDTDMPSTATHTATTTTTTTKQIIPPSHRKRDNTMSLQVVHVDRQPAPAAAAVPVPPRRSSTLRATLQKPPPPLSPPTLRKASSSGKINGGRADVDDAADQSVSMKTAASRLRRVRMSIFGGLHAARK